MRSPALLAALALTSGCALDPLTSSPPETCSEARRLPSGLCCPAWSRASAGGSCDARKFSRSTSSDAVGEGGVARVIELAIDASGQGIAAWQHVDGTGARAAVAEEQPGGAWSLRTPGDALPGSGTSLDIAAGPDGSAIVAWKQTEGESGMIFASARSSEGAWADPADLADRVSFLPTAYEPRLATRSSGETLLVWNQRTSSGYGVALARRASSGAPWELPNAADDVLSPPLFFSNAPQIAVNERGDALVTWYQSTGGPLLVRASERFGDGGSFSRPGPDDILSAPGAPVDSHPIANPIPAVGPSGEAAIIWTQEDGAGAIPVYLATRSPDGVWQKPADLTDSFSTPAGIARCPQIAFGPGGELYVVWYQDQGDGDRVYAARRSPAGEWLETGRSPAMLSTAGAVAFTPALAVGSGGAALVVWIEQAGDRSRAAARRTGSGEAWGPLEVLSPDDAGDATSPAAVIAGPSERALVAWSQGDLTSSPVFFATVE
jgi:hypothetical protein